MVCDRRPLTQDETRLSSMSSQKEKVQKYAGIDVGAHAAQSTHSVCLISVSLCILYIYWAVSVK